MLARVSHVVVSAGWVSLFLFWASMSPAQKRPLFRSAVLAALDGGVTLPDTSSANMMPPAFF